MIVDADSRKAVLVIVAVATLVIVLMYAYSQNQSTLSAIEAENAKPAINLACVLPMPLCMAMPQKKLN